MRSQFAYVCTESDRTCKQIRKLTLIDNNVLNAIPSFSSHKMTAINHVRFKIHQDGCHLFWVQRPRFDTLAAQDNKNPDALCLVYQVHSLKYRFIKCLYINIYIILLDITTRKGIYMTAKPQSNSIL